MGLTDRETVAAIRENRYLQFFIGLEEFTQEKPFDASSLVDFRKRFGEAGMQQIGEAIALASIDKNDSQDEDSSSESSSGDCPPTSSEGNEADQAERPNRGKLLADATCAPADIRYPTDVSLLNDAREKTDGIIDLLHEPLVDQVPRPRTYRVKARRAFVAFTKKKQPGRRAIRKAQKQQLGYLRRNLQQIDRLLTHPGALPLTELDRVQALLGLAATESDGVKEARLMIVRARLERARRWQDAT